MFLISRTINILFSLQMVTKSFALFFFCLVSFSSAFSPSWKLTPPLAAFEMDYSHDQRYIGIANDTHVVIYQAQYGKRVQELSVERDGLSSFAFNIDSTWIAVGFKDGEARLYNQDGTGQFVFTNKTFNENITSIVKSVCFASDSSTVILGLFNDQIRTWSVSDGSSLSFSFSNQNVQTVSCSPTNPRLFVVGGGLNTKSKFTFYTFNATEISVVSDVSNSMVESAQGSTFSADGAFAYRAERNGRIYRYDTTSFTEQQLNLPDLDGKPLTKVRVSNDYMFIATAYIDKAVIITNSTQSNALTVQQFDSIIPSVALSPTGGHLLYVATNGQGQVASSCPNGQYLNNGVCVNCNPGCEFCDQNPNTCFSCTNKFFLVNTQCEKCVVGCQVCNNNVTCTTCDTVGHFRINATNQCTCQTSYFLRQQLCVACAPGCIDCVDDAQCKTCKPQFDNIGGICTCRTGTYIFGDTCLNCVRGCQRCTNGVECQACNVQGHYNLNSEKLCECTATDHVEDNGTDCVCIQRYYNQSNICLQCPLGCQTCQSSTLCNTCENAQLVVRDGVCKCIDTASFIDPNLNCQRCADTLQFCIQCNNANTCLTCQAGINRSVKDGKCECNAGFYPDSDLICQSCSVIQGCLQCENENVCKVCDANLNWQNDPTNNLCRCKRHYSQDNGTCYQCGVGCARCDRIQCLQCAEDEHWIVDGLGCKCAPAFYQVNQLCLDCIPGCIECVNGEQCQTCDTVAHFSNKNGTCECIAGYYLDDRTCFTCSHSIAYCQSCSYDGSTCNKCIGSIELINNLCTCQKGKWVNQSVCSDCPEGCLDCQTDDYCKECEKDYDLQDGVCKKTGLDTLIIVLIIVGVIVLAGAVFVVVKCIKKRRLPANGDDYEEL